MSGVEVHQPSWRSFSFEFPFLVGRVWRVLACLAGTGYFALSPRYRLFLCVKPPSKGVVFIG